MSLDFTKNAAAPPLRALAPTITHSWVGTTALACVLLLGCASTPGNDDNADKVWMRAGSTEHSEFAENTCRATATTNADFKLCMMSAGWKLETPPSP